MNELKIFNNPEFGEVRTLLVNNEPYFVGKDVAKALGYSREADAIRVHVDPEDKGVGETQTPGGTQQVSIINESGLYSLILSSKLPSAKKFKHWVTSEVLPAIRTKGGYLATTTDDTPETIMARAVLIAQDTITKQKEQIDTLNRQAKQLTYANEQQKQEIAALTPDAEYTRTTLSAKNTWNANIIAKEMGMSAVTFNKKLANLGIQYKQHGVWVLTSYYQNKGYTKTQSYNYVNSAGDICSRMQTEWTETGRRFLHDLHTKGQL